MSQQRARVPAADRSDDAADAIVANEIVDLLRAGWYRCRAVTLPFCREPPGHGREAERTQCAQTALPPLKKEYRAGRGGRDDPDPIARAQRAREDHTKPPAVVARAGTNSSGSSHIARLRCRAITNPR